MDGFVRRFNEAREAGNVLVFSVETLQKENLYSSI